MSEFTRRQIQTGNRRLLTLAKELEKVRAARYVRSQEGFRGYDQETVLHPCGAPACAWGHYVVNNRRRRKRITEEAKVVAALTNSSPDTYEETVLGEGVVELPSIWGGNAMREFAITREAADELFESHGCGAAQTGKQAAAYIRKFVAKRTKELK